MSGARFLPGCRAEWPAHFARLFSAASLPDDTRMSLLWVPNPDGTCFTATVRGIVLRVEANGLKNGAIEWFGQAVKRDGVTPLALTVGPDRERLMADLEAAGWMLQDLSRFPYARSVTTLSVPGSQ